jgi:UDP-N-acetylmuramyl pentapeptide phosphotransferase/UDP-N-acetylglucosamine-1-phosphate transferase
LLLPSFILVLIAAGLCAALILLLKPWLVRYAMARPSARGLHTVPTPQGGGIAVLIGCACGAGVGAGIFGLGASEAARLASILGAAAGLAVLGLIDDIRPLPALPRLLAQLVLMGVGIAALPEGARPLPFLPFGIERAVLVLAGAWFVNLTNFMDGMDWMTIAEMVPVSATLVLFWQFGALPVVAGLLALGLLGGLLGYAPFNKPPARLFLGDVGSLPIGFLIAFCLFSLAGHANSGTSYGPLAAAVLLPLYYIADSGITLLWRLRRRERIWEPHRSHFYQMAVAKGLSVWAVLARVFAVNIALAGLALATGRGESWITMAVCVVAGIAAVALLLRVLVRPHMRPRASALPRA